VGTQKVRANLIGKKFGKLTVIEFAEINKHKKSMWKCRCDCGKEVIVLGSHLVSGHTVSCGKHAKFVKHGQRHTKLYKVWLSMKNRCNNTADCKYNLYGGRGIRVCEEWQSDFQAYHDYVSSLPHYGEKGYSLDRIDNDGNYEPGNVRWATQKEQSNNKRTNIYISCYNETHTLKEWSDITGVNYSTIHGRYKRGKSPEEILQKVKVV
jgi:hypothetical protein